MGNAALVFCLLSLVLASSAVYPEPWGPLKPRRSLKELRLRAISKLENLSSQDQQVQKTIRETIKEITKSLSHRGQGHFMSGAQILSAPHGKRVFRRSKRAIDLLLKGISRPTTPDAARTVYQKVINMLVDSEASIAERCVLTAKRLVELDLGSKRRTRKAREQYDRALRETDPKQAADGFEDAWETAQGVVRFKNLLTTTFRDGPDPFSPRLGPNTLSLTFEILEQGRFSLEFVQIIREPRTGANVRVLINSPWDGRNAGGSMVPDGRYTYIAYGQLLPPRSKKDKEKDQDITGRRLRIRPSSFPVYGSILVDKTPPTIESRLSPQPNEYGWHNSEVSVSFKGQDRLSGLASTSPTVIVNSEGTKQSVTGTATDRAGNRSDLEVSLNLDLQAPILRILGPNSGVTLNTPMLTVIGSAIDPLSGLETVTCNGNTADMTSAIFTCELALKQGTNEITIQGSDLAGNVASATLRVHRSAE